MGRLRESEDSWCLSPVTVLASHQGNQAPPVGCGAYGTGMGLGSDEMIDCTTIRGYHLLCASIASSSPCLLPPRLLSCCSPMLAFHPYCQIYHTGRLVRLPCGEVLKPEPEGVSTQSMRAGCRGGLVSRGSKTPRVVIEADSVLQLVSTACLADCEMLFSG